MKRQKLNSRRTAALLASTLVLSQAEPILALADVKVETAAEVLKKRKLKRKQYFRRQQLKKQKEKRLYAPQTPSMLFVVAFVVVKSRTRMIRRNPAFRGRFTTISFSR